MKNTIGSALNQIGDLGKDIGKGIASEGEKMTKTAAGQVGVPEAVLEKKEGLKINPETSTQVKQEVLQNKDTENFVKELYGSTPQSSESAVGKPQELPKTKDAKTVEEQQKIASLRNQLHGKYYQELVNRPKPKEERAVEKVDREKQEERWALQEKEKKKPPPLAVTQAANKTEKFPGASG